MGHSGEQKVATAAALFAALALPVSEWRLTSGRANPENGPLDADLAPGEAAHAQTMTARETPHSLAKGRNGAMTR